MSAVKDLLARYRTGTTLGGGQKGEEEFDIAKYRDDLRKLAAKTAQREIIFTCLIVGMLAACVFLMVSTSSSEGMTKLLIGGGTGAPILLLLAMLRKNGNESGIFQMMLLYASNQRDPRMVNEVVNTLYAGLVDGPMQEGKDTSPAEARTGQK